MHHNDKPPNPDFVGLVRRLTRLHELIAQGKGDEPEADALRDEMDLPWRRLTPAEMELIDELSADLYTLDSDALSKHPQEGGIRSSELLTAWEAKNWRRIRDLIAKQPEGVSADFVGYIRGRCWEHVAGPEAAIPFFREAAGRKPDFAAALVRALCDAGQTQEGLLEAKSFAARADRLSPYVLSFLVQTVFSSTRSMPPPTAFPVWQECADLFRTALAAQDRLPESQKDRQLSSMTCVVLGMCHQMLGDIEAAHGSLDLALVIDADSELALTVRGLLLNAHDPLQALADFRQAVSRNTTLFWPYAYLARNAIVSGEYGQAVNLCSKALFLTKEPGYLAEVHEWMAIAKSCLDYPSAEVREHFDAAIALSPNQDRIRRNLDAWESQSDPTETREISWDVPEIAVPEGSVAAALQLVGAP